MLPDLFQSDERPEKGRRHAASPESRQLAGGTFSNAAELLAQIAGGVADRNRITDVTLFCGPDDSLKALCLVDTHPECAPEIALRLGGQVYGFSTVTLGIVLAPGFHCHVHCGTMPTNRRCSCRLPWPPEESAS